MFKLIRTVLIATILLGCNNSAGPDPIGLVDSPSLILQSVIAEIGAVAGSTEGGAITPMAACSYASQRTCTSAFGRVRWAGCTIGQSTLSGGWDETFSTNACCNTFGNNCSVSRVSATTSAVLPSGASFVTSTESLGTEPL